MKDIKKALKEYDTIVKGVRSEYTKEELTIDIIRQEHPELNFMDDEELQIIIDYANNGRGKNLFLVYSVNGKEGEFNNMAEAEEKAIKELNNKYFNKDEIHITDKELTVLKVIK